jgi:hypothetical protein
MSQIRKIANQIFRFASIYKEATRAETHKWASSIVNKAFQQVMGRLPTTAEKQIVMAVSDLESSYGRGWKNNGKKSHNWGAIQTRSKSSPSFSYQDSSVQGKYQTKFKSYPDDVSGAADVVIKLFKDTRKQQMLDPNRDYRTFGGSIPGPGRGELVEQAAQTGDTTAFSKAMFYTTYYEGFAKDWVDRIKDHAKGIQTRINNISSSLGESPAWSIKSENYFPITNDQSILDKISNMSPKILGNKIQTTYQPQSSNAPIANKPQVTIQDLTANVDQAIQDVWSNSI